MIPPACELERPHGQTVESTITLDAEKGQVVAHDELPSECRALASVSFHCQLASFGGGSHPFCYWLLCAETKLDCAAAPQRAASWGGPRLEQDLRPSRWKTASPMACHGRISSMVVRIVAEVDEHLMEKGDRPSYFCARTIPWASRWGSVISRDVGYEIGFSFVAEPPIATSPSPPPSLDLSPKLSASFWELLHLVVHHHPSYVCSTIKFCARVFAADGQDQHPAPPRQIVRRTASIKA